MENNRYTVKQREALACFNSCARDCGLMSSFSYDNTDINISKDINLINIDLIRFVHKNPDILKRWVQIENPVIHLDVYKLNTFISRMCKEMSRGLTANQAWDSIKNYT